MTRSGVVASTTIRHLRPDWGKSFTWSDAATGSLVFAGDGASGFGFSMLAAGTSQN